MLDSDSRAGKGDAVSTVECEIFVGKLMEHLCLNRSAVEQIVC